SLVVDQVPMLDRIDACPCCILDGLGAVGMRARRLSGRMRLIDSCLHFLHCELGGAYLRTWSQNAAARDQLDVVGAGLELRPRRAANAIRTVRLGAQLPTVTAGHADCHPAQHQPRSLAKSLLGGPAQREVDM